MNDREVMYIGIVPRLNFKKQNVIWLSLSQELHREMATGRNVGFPHELLCRQQPRRPFQEKIILFHCSTSRLSFFSPLFVENISVFRKNLCSLFIM